MGMAKQAMMEHEEGLAAAAGFLVSVGTLQRCEFHGDLYDGDGDLEQAYKTAAYKLKRGDLPFAEGKTQREATDLIKEAYDDNCGPDECPSCARIRDRD